MPRRYQNQPISKPFAPNRYADDHNGLSEHRRGHFEKADEARMKKRSIEIQTPHESQSPVTNNGSPGFRIQLTDRRHEKRPGEFTVMFQAKSVHRIEN
jgi:hypothetical protein